MSLSIVRKTNSKNHSLDNLLNSFWDPFLMFPESYRIQQNKYASNDFRFFDFEYDGDDLVVSCDVPGIKLEDIRLEIEGNQLRVDAARKGIETKRVTTIPKEYDTETVEATLENGVLSIRLKKMASAKAKTISIKEKR